MFKTSKRAAPLACVLKRWNVEERRRGESGEMSISGTVRSMLLEKWVLDISMALIENYTIFIPGWLINLESDKILHGRNGRLYDLVSLK